MNEKQKKVPGSQLWSAYCRSTFNSGAVLFAPSESVVIAELEAEKRKEKILSRRKNEIKITCSSLFLSCAVSLR
jgi:hypothetical protein